MTPESLQEFATAMARFRVLRYKGDVGPPEQEGEEHVEIELHPSAFDAVPVPPATAITMPPPEPEPTMEELLFASSVPVTKYERDGKDPE